jgi:hypothetical protein
MLAFFLISKMEIIANFNVIPLLNSAGLRGAAAVREHT